MCNESTTCEVKLPHAPEKKAHSGENERELTYLFSHHLFTLKNDKFERSLNTLFINNNAYLKQGINKRFLFEFKGLPAVLTTNVSKWLTWYRCEYLCEASGELISIEKESESLKKARARALNCLNIFDEFYREKYRKHEVTCMFITLSNVPHAKHSIRSFLMQYKKALKRSGLSLLGYVWVSEVSFKGKIEGGHWHYHIALALERLHVKGKKLPHVLTQAYLGSPFGGGLWGQKTHSIFMYGSTITSGYGKGTVKTAVSLYLNKYMSKESGAVLGVRRFGASKNITQHATSKRKAKQGVSLANTP